MQTIRARWANTNKGRIQRKDDFWSDKKKKFAIAVAASFILIQLLFLGMLSYLYGSAYENSTRIHNFPFLMVDYDGEIIGESLRYASSTLAGPSFPTVHEGSPAQYPTAQDVFHAVWTGDYWGAIYTSPNASHHLSQALQGGRAADTYNANLTLTFIHNSARYSSQDSGVVVANLQKLVAASRLVYNKYNGTGAVAALNTTSSGAIQALLDPIASTAIDIKPTPQGTKSFYSTVSMVMPIMMQFFFLMAVNGVAANFNLYSHLPLLDNIVIRYSLCFAYTFIGSLCQAGYQHAFFESAWLSPGQFVLTWMTIWLYMHINFLFIDCLTGFVPPQFLGFFFFAYVICNMTSVTMPFELSPAFYQWGNALPARNTLQVLITVWSAGAANQLNVNLPVLFAWEIVLLPLSLAALRLRCSHAAKEYNDNEVAMHEKYGFHPPTEVVEQVKQDSLMGSLEMGAESVTVGSPRNVPLAAGNGYFPCTPMPFQDTLQKVLSVKTPDAISDPRSSA